MKFKVTRTFEALVEAENEDEAFDAAMELCADEMLENGMVDIEPFDPIYHKSLLDTANLINTGK